MPQYILVCNHPRLEDTDPEPDETYYEIIYRREEHIAPETVSDDESALKWAENHTGVVVTKTSIEVEIPCKFLVDGKCACYETRPECCRNHQVGGDMCRDAIKKMHSAEKQTELLEMKVV